jgi:hypothetical protein
MAQAKRKKTPRLRSIPGGREEKPPAAGSREVERLLSGRVSRKARIKKRGKRSIPPQELPPDLMKISNLLVAGRAVEKEISFKIDFARHQVEEFCIRDFARRFAETQRRPPSIEYSADHSRFKFVMTVRTSLNPEMIEALEQLGVDLNEHTQLQGLELNYEAIRQHRLEDRLRQALESMHLAPGVLEEVFTEKVALQDSFYELLVPNIEKTLRSGENLEEKIFEVLRILHPATQIRNAEPLDLSIDECFDLVRKADIEAEEEIA